MAPAEGTVEPEPPETQMVVAVEISWVYPVTRAHHLAADGSGAATDISTRVMFSEKLSVTFLLVYWDIP